MLVRLLGPVGAGPVDGPVTPAPGRVPAAVLAQLALAQGRLVSSEALADGTWDRPPASARNALQVAISKLRKLYGPELVESASTGYRLRTSLVRVDWEEASRRAADAATALERGRPGEALASVEAALSLFTGQPFAGWETVAADAARRRAEALLLDLRLLEARCHLGTGAGDRAVALLQAQASAAPLHEPLHQALMEALSAAGRPAEALQVYEGVRRRLVEELGADPSPQLQELFGRLLAGTGPALPARPVPRAAGATRLPVHASPLLGREWDVDAVSGLIRAGHRLLTLLGPGGIGKTRLSVAVARRLAQDPQQSAYFVDLTEVPESSGVLVAVETALDAAVEDWATALGGERTLLVLDNAEHVLEGVRDVAGRALHVEGVSVLVTSRTPLRLGAERPFAVDPLPAARPEDPAVLLLADRAGLLPDQLRTVEGALCELAARADGVPLVLELLGSALRWYAPAELLGQLEDRLVELRSQDHDRPARHLSLEAVTRWSLHQATLPARAALGALTVPRGSVDLQAATELVAAAVPQESAPMGLLSELLDLSLLQRLPDPGQIRLRVLEPIRLAALRSPLVPAPADAVRVAHARHYLAAAEEADAQYATTGESARDLVRHDDANLRQAVEWLWDHDPDAAAQHLGSALFTWYYNDRDDDVVAWARRALATGAGSPAARARVALAGLSSLLWQRSADSADITRLFDIVAPCVDDFDPEWRRRWIACQSSRHLLLGDPDAALRWLREYPADTPHAQLRLHLAQMEAFGYAGQHSEATSAITRALQSTAIADHPRNRAALLNAAGYSAVIDGRLDEAAAYLGTALTLCHTHGLLAQAGMVANNLAWLALEKGEFSAAISSVAGALEEPRLRTDRLQVVEAATIAGLALHGLGHLRAASDVAHRVAHLHAEGRVLDAYGHSKVVQLLTLTEPVRGETGDGAYDHAPDVVHLVLGARELALDH